MIVFLIQQLNKINEKELRREKMSIIRQFVIFSSRLHYRSHLHFHRVFQPNTVLLLRGLSQPVGLRDPVGRHPSDLHAVRAPSHIQVNDTPDEPRLGGKPRREST